MRKTLSTIMLAWALWWVQELVERPELPLDIVKLSVHETQEACEQRAAAVGRGPLSAGDRRL